MAMANASYRTLHQLLFLQDRRRKRNAVTLEAERPVEPPRAIGNSRHRGGIAELPDRTPPMRAGWLARAPLNCRSGTQSQVVKIYNNFYRLRTTERSQLLQCSQRRPNRRRCGAL